MNGFIATSESVFALTLFLSILLMIAVVYPFPKVKNEAYVRALSMDLLDVFEKDGRLQSLDKNGIREVLRALPASVCIELEIAGKKENQTTVIKKPGCGDEGNDLVVTYRTFTDGNATKLASATGWIKGD